MKKIHIFCFGNNNLFVFNNYCICKYLKLHIKKHR